ncbi:intermembrane phospholipid transport protein YdbH family protein [Azospirillum sp. A39]|uniref:intermembrane phospholipid transport protein YdbH family protein n=1 Tax=Azospirillum sp. A39 TaxID=3462279 RepID=UPI0040460C33
MRRLAIGLVVLVGLAACLVVAWADLLEAGMTLALRRAGFPEARVTVVRAGIDWTRAAVALGPTQRLGTVTLIHPWRDLLDGRVGRVVVSGAELRLDVDAAGGIRVAGWPLPGGGSTSGSGAGGAPSIPALPLDVAVQDSTLRVTWPGGAATLPVDLTVTAGESPDVHAALRAVELDAAVTVDGRLRRDGSFTAAVTVEAAALDRLPGVTGLAGRAAVTGDVGGRLDGAHLRLAVGDCLSLTAAGLAVAGQRLELPGGLCLAGPEDGEAVVLPLDGGAPTLRLVATAPRVDLPGHGLSVESLRATATLQAGALTGDATAGRVAAGARPAPFAPFSLSAHAEGPLDGTLALTARAEGPAGVRATVSGSHALATGEGRAELRLEPVAFRPDGLQPAVLAPQAAALLHDVAGTMAARGSFAWGAKGLSTTGRVLLTDVAAASGPVAVSGVNGVVRLSSLLPPVVPDGQELAVKLLDVGLPLTDGVLRFGLDRRATLDVDRAEWHWAGGTVRARPFELPLAAPKGTITLEAVDLDLGAVLDLVEVEGLAATGRLDGVLPVALDGDTVRIDGAALSAAGGGTLRYDPAEPPAFLAEGEPGSPTALLMGALTDFRYESLDMTINGVAGGELVVGLAIRGANPEFYDGYPVALNLNVSGALDRILRQSLDAYRIPDAVRERMLEFEQ